jgi:hypothetical protein
MKDEITTHEQVPVMLEIEDLAPGGVELSDEEIRAVSGGLCGSWTSGGCGATDEWQRC